MSFVVKRTLIVAALLGLLCLSVGWLTHAYNLRELRQRLSGEAALLAEHAARSLEGIDLTLGELVRRIEADWRDGRPPSAAYHRILRERVGELPQVTGIVIVDRDGQLVADQITAEPRALDLGERVYFKAHAEHRLANGRFLGDPVRGSVSGRSFFSASYALTDPAGRFGGVVAATFDPFYYRRHYESLNPHGRRREFALVDGDGFIMASSSDLSAAVEVEKAMMPQGVGYQPAATPGGFMRIALPGGDEVHLAAMVRVPMFPFYAYVGMPEREAFKSWRYVAAGLALAWLMASLGSAAAFAGIWRRETERQEAFNAMQQANLETSRALERTEAANAAKSRFLAHMRHELRTPLNAILGFSEVIRDGVFGDNRDKDREYAGLIHRSGRHLLHIINDILDLSRIEAGKVALRRDALKVAEVFEAAALLASGDFEEGQVQLACRVPEDLPQLYADEKAVKQMLVNLLSNAAKFAAPGERIELRAEATPDGGVALSVADRGPGIPQQRLDSIFQPFGSSEAQVSSEGEGTGIGLPLVKSLIELHGGCVDIDSELGRGTVVTLLFPPQEGPALIPSSDSPPLRAEAGA